MAVTTRRMVLAGIGASILGSLGGCLSGAQVETGSPGDILIWNDDNTHHRITVTVSDMQSEQTIADYTVDIDPDERHTEREVLSEPGEYAVRAELENGMVATYDEVWMWMNKTGTLTGIGVQIRVTDQSEFRIGGFGDHRWPPHKRDDK
jgi:hypothetical protein